MQSCKIHHHIRIPTLNIAKSNPYFDYNKPPFVSYQYTKTEWVQIQIRNYIDQMKCNGPINLGDIVQFVNSGTNNAFSRQYINKLYQSVVKNIENGANTPLPSKQLSKRKRFGFYVCGWGGSESQRGKWIFDGTGGNKKVVYHYGVVNK